MPGTGGDGGMSVSKRRFDAFRLMLAERVPGHRREMTAAPEIVSALCDKQDRRILT